VVLGVRHGCDSGVCTLLVRRCGGSSVGRRGQAGATAAAAEGSWRKGDRTPVTVADYAIQALITLGQCLVCPGCGTGVLGWRTVVS